MDHPLSNQNHNHNYTKVGDELPPSYGDMPGAVNLTHHHVRFAPQTKNDPSGHNNASPGHHTIEMEMSMYDSPPPAYSMQPSVGCNSIHGFYSYHHPSTVVPSSVVMDDGESDDVVVVHNTMEPKYLHSPLDTNDEDPPPAYTPGSHTSRILARMKYAPDNPQQQQNQPNREEEEEEDGTAAEKKPVKPVQSSSLPLGWEEKRHKNGRMFYVNHLTQAIQWDRPTWDPAEEEMAVIDEGSHSSSSTTAENELTHAQEEWEERFASNGRPYYVNHTRQTTTWDRPMDFVTREERLAQQCRMSPSELDRHQEQQSIHDIPGQQLGPPTFKQCCQRNCTCEIILCPFVPCVGMWTLIPLGIFLVIIGQMAGIVLLFFSSFTIFVYYFGFTWFTCVAFPCCARTPCLLEFPMVETINNYAKRTHEDDIQRLEQRLVQLRSSEPIFTVRVSCSHRSGGKKRRMVYVFDHEFPIPVVRWKDLSLNPTQWIDELKANATSDGIIKFTTKYTLPPQQEETLKHIRHYLYHEHRNRDVNINIDIKFTTVAQKRIDSMSIPVSDDKDGENIYTYHPQQRKCSVSRCCVNDKTLPFWAIIGCYAPTVCCYFKRFQEYQYVQHYHLHILDFDPWLEQYQRKLDDIETRLLRQQRRN